ncbi:hypothetical protein BY996DRAFT_6415776 [Phakopsora pachyrhizi]|nr:hypothetical protein BY996DRAFT_6415776 [Phakopsora pachyrhizi]
MNSKSPHTTKRAKSSRNVENKIINRQISESSDEDQELNENNEDDLEQQSFAERLKILNIQTKKSEILGVEDQESKEEAEEGKEDTLEGSKASRIKSRNHVSPTKSYTPILPVSSLAQTLTQALNSADSKLLETCFLQSDKTLISNTLARLPRPLVHNLIEQLVLRLNRKKRGAGDGATVPSVRRTKTLVEWVRQTLLIHMSYLLTIPSVANQLSMLHASLQKRLNLHSKLLSLNGRLELILHQIESNRPDVDQNLPLNKPNGLQTSKLKHKNISGQKPSRYTEGEGSSSDHNESSSDSSSHSDDEDAIQLDSEEDGSLEDVVLGSGSDGEGSESSNNDLVLLANKYTDKNLIYFAAVEVENQISI